MKNIIKIIKELQSNSGRIDKENILEVNKGNELFKKVVKFVYNPYIVTGLSKKKINKKVKVAASVEFNSIEEVMEYLKLNNTGTDKDIANMQEWLNKQDDKEILTQIITKELKCGITAKTINKVFGSGFIPEFNLMLAQSYFKDDNFNRVISDFVLTTKLDGMRVVAVREENEVKFLSRQGQVILGLNQLSEEFLMLPNNMAYDGELLLKNDSRLSSDDLYRETMKVARKDGEKKNLEFHMFDMLPLSEFQAGESKDTYINRRNEMEKIFENNNFKYIVNVPILYYGDDKSVINRFLDLAKENNEEGLMLNTYDGLYQSKRSFNILKIKLFLNGDMRVINVAQGDGRNKGKLGAITVEFEHEGKIHICDVGSGFSDDERELYFKQPELLLGKIVTIKYFEISKNQKGGFGLRFPTWEGRIRNDKTEISMN